MTGVGWPRLRLLPIEREKHAIFCGFFGLLSVLSRSLRVQHVIHKTQRHERKISYLSRSSENGFFCWSAGWLLLASLRGERRRADDASPPFARPWLLRLTEGGQKTLALAWRSTTDAVALISRCHSRDSLLCLLSLPLCSTILVVALSSCAPKLPSLTSRSISPSHHTYPPPLLSICFHLSCSCVYVCMLCVVFATEIVPMSCLPDTH